MFFFFAFPVETCLLFSVLLKLLCKIKIGPDNLSGKLKEEEDRPRFDET